MTIARGFRGGVTIATAADIITIRWRRDYDKHFILTADIDLSDHPMDLSRCIESFSAVFDGNGHTISNFTWISEKGPCGLFRFIRDPNAVIKNLGLVDPNVQTTAVAAVGGLVGYLWEGTVQDCYVSGGRIAGCETVGGLVGRVRLAGKITGCHSTAAVSGVSCLGGLVGENGGIISNCWSVASVSGDFWGVGGLVGRNGGSLATGVEPGRIRKSYAGGTVRGDRIIGGLVGYNEYSSIVDCCSMANVIGNSVVGGLAGEQNLASIVRAYAIGRVTGGERAGGLVGLAYVWRTRGGGSTGGSEQVDERNTVEASFWDVAATGLSVSGGGEGRTTAQMQEIQTYLDAGWDFVGETANGAEDIWWIDEGEDYPRLWWEPRPAVRLPVIELDAADFDAGIAQGVVLVDFFATWCPPCRTQGPILEEVADRLEGRARVAKVDIDKARSIMQRYNVTAVPTLILFREGIEVKRFVGVTGADVLVAAVLEAVGSP
jgi:thioredoxin